MSGTTDPPAMRTEEFRLLRERVNRAFGIWFADDQLYIVERRLRDRVRALGLRDFSEYYRHLLYHSTGRAELEQAADRLTTNETYFFREEYQLRAFQKDLLPRLRLRNRRQRRLAIWSAGCSSGEEVFTIAMLLLDSGLFDGWDVRVFGSDVSRRVLGLAREGTYRESAFRTTPPGWRERWFVERGAAWKVSPRVRALCHFAHLNLVDSERCRLLGRVDVVFCRNVLIYFDDLSRRRVVDTLFDRLQPGGWLLLGHSESLLNQATPFEVSHVGGELVYRRPALGDEQETPPVGPPPKGMPPVGTPPLGGT